MSDRLVVTVGPKEADFTGADHLALQAAVDYAARFGGAVKILPGTFEMGNSLFIRDGVDIVGSGDDTVLRKCPSSSTPLVDDIDWYGTEVRVKDPSPFSVGGALLLRGKSPHVGNDQFVKHTVMAIDGNTIHIDRDPRCNFWIDSGADAATLFPIITGDYVNDVTIESFCIDGNKRQNENFNGNYSGGVFIQDCDRITLRNLTIINNNSDGISYQVCDDVVIENCRCEGNTDTAIHAGSGSQRTTVRGNAMRGGSVGFVFCWGVRHGVLEDNIIEDAATGMSIGHRDTDNIIRRNQIRRSSQNGILFREHPVSLRDPHRNVFEDNVIEESGKSEECVAIEMLGAAEDVVLRRNQIAETRRRSKKRTHIGLRIGEKIRNLCLEGNEFIKQDKDIVDLR